MSCKTIFTASPARVSKPQLYSLIQPFNLSLSETEIYLCVSFLLFEKELARESKRGLELVHKVTGTT
jgi:hypothetical protein